MTLKTGTCPMCGSKKNIMEERLRIQGAPKGMENIVDIYVDALSCKGCGFMEFYRKGPTDAW